jgi:hypothetical protein
MRNINIKSYTLYTVVDCKTIALISPFKGLCHEMAILKAYKIKPSLFTCAESFKIFEEMLVELFVKLEQS